jgi:hypothetical protein
MNKRVIAAAMLLGGAPFASIAQEMPYEIKVCSTTEASVVDRVDGVTVLANTARGIADSVRPGGAFDKTSFECRSVVNASKAGFDYTSRCLFVDADGHKVVGASVGDAQGWKWTFLGGTGKWEGIQGGGTGKSTARYPRLSPAVSAGCGLAVGTYSLKK